MSGECVWWTRGPFDVTAMRTLDITSVDGSMGMFTCLVRSIGRVKRSDGSFLRYTQLPISNQEEII